MSTPNPPSGLPLVQSYHPTTFLERGVAMPFTTPMLAGTRARPSERNGIELIVPNPSGSRGVYILPWTGVRELCKPTVHDARLHQKVSTLKSVTPSLIRTAVRAVAAEGLAGREALAAAGAKVEADHQDHMVANFLLLMALVEQLEPAGAASRRPDRTQAPDLETRAKRTIAELAPKIGWSADTVATALEELAGVFAGVGIAAHANRARIPRLLDALVELRDECAVWSQANSADSAGPAGMIAAVSALTITCARATLAECWGMTTDVASLIQAWGQTPDRLGAKVARSDWLLDGWEHICLLWRSAADGGQRRSVIGEIASQVPTLPKEVSEWISMAPDSEAQSRFRKSVILNEDWRTGSTVFDRVARNEHLLALAA